MDILGVEGLIPHALFQFYLYLLIVSGDVALIWNV